ncbi:MAG: hypothetical protein KIS92_14030 [Planctomycetota bacterium]|nr:hypothetical protein [Planctomycetota bacterium]
MTSCKCSARGNKDFLAHESECPYFKKGVVHARDQVVKDLTEAAERIDQLADRLSSLQVGGSVNHKIANIRMMLLGESFRMRKAAGQLKDPMAKMSASG